MERVTERELGGEDQRLEKTTETTKMVTTLEKMQFRWALDAAQKGEPVAWCMVGVQPEIIRGFGIADVYPENYAAIASAKRQIVPYLESAESRGFPTFLCSYARYGLGYTYRMLELGGHVPPSPEEVPWGGMARPDIILGRGQCEPGYKWFQAMGNILDIPVFIHEEKCIRIAPGSSPIQPYDDPEFRGALIAAEIQDNKDMIAWIGDKLKRKINWDKVIEAFYLQNEMRRLWNGVFELRKAIPSPMPSEDMVSAIYPGYCLAGTTEAVDFYRKLYDEVKDRVEKKLCIIPELQQEKYRLLWGGIAIWQYTGFYKYVQNFGAVFVTENQYYRDAFLETDTDPNKDPLRAIAERHFYESKMVADRAKHYGTGDIRSGLVLEMIDEYHCDGAVLHFLISCRPVVIGWTHTYNLIREKTGIPTMPLESDMCDPRSVSPADIKNKAQAFLEVVANYKQAQERAGGSAPHGGV